VLCDVSEIVEFQTFPFGRICFSESEKWRQKFLNFRNFIVAAVGGNAAAGKLLVLNQVILSFALIFAVVPLVHFTSSRAKMGSFVTLWLTRIAATITAILIAGLNAYLIVQSIRLRTFGSAGDA